MLTRMRNTVSLNHVQHTAKNGNFLRLSDGSGSPKDESDDLISYKLEVVRSSPRTSRSAPKLTLTTADEDVTESQIEIDSDSPSESSEASRITSPTDCVQYKSPSDDTFLMVDRRRSWRTTMQKAKDKAWRALKYSKSFSGSPSSRAAEEDRPKPSEPWAVLDALAKTKTNTNTNSVSFVLASSAASIMAAAAKVAANTTANYASNTAAGRRSLERKTESRPRARQSLSMPPPDARLPAPVSSPSVPDWSNMPSSNDQFQLPHMTARQRHCLRTTWRRIRANGGLQFTERIFQRLFSVVPCARKIFYKAAFLSAFSRASSRDMTTCSSDDSATLMTATSTCKDPSTITTCRDHAWIILHLLDALIEPGADGSSCSSNDDSASSQQVKKFKKSTCQVRRWGAQHAFLADSGMRSEMWEKFGELAVDVVRGYDYVRLNAHASRAWTILFAAVTDEIRHGYDRECRTKRLAAEEKRATSCRRREAV